MKQDKYREPSPQPESSHMIHKKEKKEILDRFRLGILIVILSAILSVLGIGCPIKYFTGISCPGCGMTRAIWAAFHLDFLSAWHYHPLFPLVPVMVFLFLFQSLLPKKLSLSAWILIFVLLLVVYLIRLFLLKDSIVMIDPWSGYLLRMVHFLIS